MNTLIDQAIRLSVALAAVLAATFTLRRQSAALRHSVLAAGIFCALAMPVGRLLVPEWSVVLPPPSIQLPAATLADPGSGTGVASPAPRAHAIALPVPGNSWLGLAALVTWAGGAAAGLLVLLVGIARLVWHERRARPIEDGAWTRLARRLTAELGIRWPVAILETPSPWMIGAWGWRHPVVMLPRGAGGWPELDVEIVLRHELSHLARGDWAVQLAGYILRALHWFNPLAWIACARLRLESEQACDDLVLRAGVRGDEYAARLLHLALLTRRGQWTALHPAPGMARSSSLERRVTAMLDPRLARTAVSGRARLAIAVLALAVALPLAGMAVVGQSHDGFSGSVLDPSGRNISNARIVLTQAQGKDRHELRSDDRGRFDFGGLAPGDYAMEVSLPGFMTVRGSITVPPGGVTRDVRLQLGSVHETVVVAGGSPSAASGGSRQARERRPAPPCVAGDTGGNLRAPMKLKDVKPDYPAELQSASVAGLVVVEGVLARDGTVRDLQVLQTPHPDLAKSVIAAVTEWRFTPTLLNCEPADIKIKVDANFVVGR